MILLFIPFLFIFLFLLKDRSLAMLLMLIQVVAVGGTFFLGKNIDAETTNDYGLLFMMTILILLIVIPWSSYYNIKTILPVDEKKLKILTWILLVLSSISFVVLLIITIIVQTAVEDINEYKYTTGVQEDFIANNLPFPNSLFSLAMIFSYFGQFLLPLHFYYLSKKKYFLSIFCFLFSLNIMLLGLTYFSRAAVVHYVFLYIAMLYLLYGVLDFKTKKIIRRSFLVLGTLFIIYFVNLSVKRFEDDAKTAKKYSQTIPVDAITQDPLTYSFFDYTSQGYINGFVVLQLYEGEGFNGAITLEKIYALVSTPHESYLRLKYRQKLWPYEYSYSFLGFPAYAIYDYGLAGSVVFCFVYFLVVRYMRPRNGNIQLKNLFLIVLLVQIPLLSIFYSEVGGLIIVFLLWILIHIYLNFKLVKS